MNILSLLLATTAFGLLGLGTDPHYRRRLGRYPRVARRTMLRAGGWLALFASVIPAFLSRGWVFGPILWTGAVMAGAVIAFLALNFSPARTDERR